MKAYQLCPFLAAQWNGVVGFIPLPEGCAVHQNNAVLHQGLGSHKLIVGGIVHNVNDPGFASATCELRVKHYKYS